MAGNKQFQRDTNLVLILDLIRQYPGISRAGIAARLQMNRSTASHIINPLLEEGWIVTSEQQRPEGLTGTHRTEGRTPIGLELQARKVLVLGLALEPGEYSWSLCALDGSIVDSAAHPVDSPWSPERIRDLAGQITAELSGKYPLCGLSLSLPGRINPQDGHIIESRALGLRNVTLGADLTAACNLPALIDNDANCCAWGLSGTGYRDFILVLIRLAKASGHSESLDHRSQAPAGGIGLGLCISGQIYYGPDFNAGEFYSAKRQAGDHVQLGIKDRDLARYSRDHTITAQVASEICNNLALLAAVLRPADIFFACSSEQEITIYQETLKAKAGNELPEPLGRPEKLHFGCYSTLQAAAGSARHFLYRLFQLPAPQAGPFDRISWQNLIQNTAWNGGRQ